VLPTWIRFRLTSDSWYEFTAGVDDIQVRGHDRQRTLSVTIGGGGPEP
jgi:hypothetical protein